MFILKFYGCYQTLQWIYIAMTLIVTFPFLAINYLVSLTYYESSIILIILLLGIFILFILCLPTCQLTFFWIVQFTLGTINILLDIDEISFETPDVMKFFLDLYYYS